MGVELAVKDTREYALGYGNAEGKVRRPISEFFQFGKPKSEFANPQVLADCYFYDLFITYFMKNWPSPPPPHPGIFEDFFPEILRRLTGSNILTLFVKSSEYFDELDTVGKILAPRNASYILLSNPILPG